MAEDDWLSFLEAQSEPRPVLVQHAKADRWHEWPCRHGEPVYTRTLIPNEVLFECDTPTAMEPAGWVAQRDGFRRLSSFMTRASIPHVLAYSGSKGFHLHLFFSADWVDPSDAVGMYAARIAIFRELPRRAGVSLAFDRTNMSWYDLGRKGRMVREFLSRKEGGLPKTWVGTSPVDGLPEIPESRPSFYRGTWPRQVPELWDAVVLKLEIDDTAAEARKVEERKVDLGGYVPDGRWRDLVNAAWLSDPVGGRPILWEPGTRYIRGRTAGRAMYTAGLEIGQAHAELRALEEHVEDKSYEFFRWHEELERVYADGDGLTYWFPPERSAVEDALSGAGL